MPPVLVDGPKTFIFFSSDANEHFHIHVKRDRLIIKVWLDPLRVASNHGYPAHEVNEILRLTAKHENRIREAWSDYFGA